MPIDAILRVSFQSSVRANQAANRALVGHAQNASGPGPFSRINTAVYECRGAETSVALASIATLIDQMLQRPDKIDFLSVSLSSRTTG